MQTGRLIQLFYKESQPVMGVPAGFREKKEDGK
jgi:hypothetical protein